MNQVQWWWYFAAYVHKSALRSHFHPLFSRRCIRSAAASRTGTSGRICTTNVVLRLSGPGTPASQPTVDSQDCVLRGNSTELIHSHVGTARSSDAVGSLNIGDVLD